MRNVAESWRFAFGRFSAVAAFWVVAGVCLAFALGWYQRLGDQWQAQGAARVVSVEALKEEAGSPSVICGEFTDEIRQELLKNPFVSLAAPSHAVRRPAVLAELAWARLQKGEADEAASLAPIYLHTAAPIET